MDLETQTSQKLHDEHMSVKAFLEKFAAELARFKPGQLPDASATVLNAMLADLIAIVEVELSVHFRFEEEWLFPLLQTGGAQDMGDLLSEEHDVILPLAYQLCAHARTFRHEGYSAAAWDEFRRGGMELAERLIRAS